MSYATERLKQLGGKRPKKATESPKQAQLSAEELKLVKQVKGAPVTASEVARSPDVLDAVITRLWRTNGQQAQD